MLGPPTSELVAGIQALVVAGILLALGYLVADLCLGRTDVDEAARWGLALAGLCTLAAAWMLLHMATSGWLYSHPGVVRGLLATSIIGLTAHRIRKSRRSAGPVWIAAGVAVLGVAVWASPVFRMMPLTATADTQLHNGWVDQLMAGETTPGAVLTGDIPNYYPWLFHSLGAITTTITPGQTPFHALGALQVLQVAGAVLALFALGRALTDRTSAGVGAALLGALSGGFGFVLLRDVDVVTDPRGNDGAEALRYQGDMLFSRSYNLAFHNIIPPFPRDLAFALLISFVLVLALRARAPAPRLDIAAGVLLGLVGLTGGETFIVAFVVALAVVAFEARRWATALRLFAPALGLYAFWIVPIVVNYVRLGGFVSITHIIPVDLPATAIAISWGLAIPLAVTGVFSVGRLVDGHASRRLVVLFIGVAAAMLIASALIPELAGDAFDTLGRKHRYWPIFYLAVALVGSLGFTRLFDSVRGSALASAAVAIVVFAVALASPVSATLAAPAALNPYEDIAAAMTEDDDNLLHVVRDLGPGCTIAAPRPVSREVFAFTGYRMLSWTGNWLGENRARIRWADIYDHITPETQRVEDNRLLTTAPEDPRWREIAQDHDLDVIVLVGDVRPPDGVTSARAFHDGEPYWVVPLQECSPR